MQDRHLFTLLEKSPCALICPAFEHGSSLPGVVASPFCVVSTVITRIITIVIIHIYWALSVLFDTPVSPGVVLIQLWSPVFRRILVKVTEQGVELRVYRSTGTSEPVFSVSAPSLACVFHRVPGQASLWGSLFFLCHFQLTAPRQTFLALPVPLQPSTCPSLCLPHKPELLEQLGKSLLMLCL